MNNSYINKVIWLLLIIVQPVLTSAQWTPMDPGFNASRSVAVQDHELFVASYLTGIKASSDDGQTWEDRSTGLPSPGGHIYAESVGSDGVWLFAGTHNGVFRSNDAGMNWSSTSLATSFGSDNYAERFFSFGNVTFAIMSTDPFNGGGLYRTDDHGANWSIGHIGMTGCGKIFNMMMHDGLLYASATGGLYISDDLGLTWTRSSPFNYLFDMSISAENELVQVVAGQFGMHYSNDGGDTWHSTTGPEDYDHADLEYFDGTFLLTIHGNDHGVYTSVDGVNWTSMAGISPVDALSLEQICIYGKVAYLGGLINIYRMTGSGVSVSPRVYLGAAYDGIDGKMRDDLRTLGLIPLEEPFTALGFSQFGSGGSEVTWNQALTATNDDAIVDWVLVELRDKNDESQIIETQSALLQSDGDVVSTAGHGPIVFNVPEDEYYVAIRHRDHLGVMTQTELALGALPRPVDFTVGSTDTYGNDARMYNNGTWMLWPGNVNNDGLLRFAGEGNDRDAILAKLGSVSVTNTLNGYYPEDINMDGKVSYDGPNNDREMMQSIIGLVPTRTILEQLP